MGLLIELSLGKQQILPVKEAATGMIRSGSHLQRSDTRHKRRWPRLASWGIPTVPRGRRQKERVTGGIIIVKCSEQEKSEFTEVGCSEF